jgi:hypothetical protein
MKVIVTIMNGKKLNKIEVKKDFESYEEILNYVYTKYDSKLIADIEVRK